MAKIIVANAPLKLHKIETPLRTLATSIINQQLSQKAADTIEARVVAVAPLDDAAAVLRAEPEKLRTAGLSWRKIEYLRVLAQAEKDGLLDGRELAKLDDAAVIARLTALRGIGVWTAEMFLMFGLRRPDIVSLGDVGLQRAARRHYGNRYRTDDAVAILSKAAQNWHPYRTVACQHLWRSLA